MKPSNLNDSQWQAVTHQGSHLLIAAGPGTGKTHTLTHRIAHTLQNNPNAHALALTFTNKAAVQMKERLEAMGIIGSRLYVGTFHSFCLKLLRDNWEKTALPKDFKIALESDLADFDKKTLEEISLIKSTAMVVVPTESYKTYQRFLRSRGLIDFDDILREALSLLENEDIAEAIRQQYPYVYIDEYQDTNIVQNALIKELSRGTMITAIGDPHQSIYGFRGSDVDLFYSFKDHFPNATVLSLTENYRSCKNLLEASAQILKGQQVALVANIAREGRLVIHKAPYDRAEADYVAQQIEKLVGGMHMNSACKGGHTFGDIAILYRCNAQRHVIIQALEHLGIPYTYAQKKKIDAYSDEAALLQLEDELEYDVEHVRLMTLHASKGLEFPVVFMIGCEEHLLPLDLEGMKGDVEEECRLFYVGMTRAKECLFLSYSTRRQLFGKTLIQEPSRFLGYIQEELKAYEQGRQRKKLQPVDDGQMKLF